MKKSELKRIIKEIINEETSWQNFKFSSGEQVQKYVEKGYTLLGKLMLNDKRFDPAHQRDNADLFYDVVLNGYEPSAKPKTIKRFLTDKEYQKKMLDKVYDFLYN